MDHKRSLPEEGFVKLPQILEVIPVSKSTWFRGIAASKYPKPVKIGARASAWRVEEIRKCIASFSRDRNPIDASAERGGRGELDELRARATELFPQAVETAITQPGETNSALEELKGLCWQNFESLGFECMANCFDAIAPRSEGKLNLAAWSDGEVTAMPWRLRVRCRPFHISSRDAHVEIQHDGPLPGITETGYRSMFVPMSKFATMTPEDYIRNEVCASLPKSRQMTLF